MKQDQAHFSQLAYGSLMGATCQLDIAKELGFIKEEEYEKLGQSIGVLSSKINALRRSQKERAK